MAKYTILANNPDESNTKIINASNPKAALIKYFLKDVYSNRPGDEGFFGDYVEVHDKKGNILIEGSEAEEIYNNNKKIQDKLNALNRK